MKILTLINWQVSLLSLLLFSLGILVIFSSSKELALQQAIFATFGFIFFLLISNFDYRSMKNLVLPIYFLVIFLLVVVLIVGFETRGSVRWIPLGLFNIQPSEFAKPVLTLFLALFWTKNSVSWKNIIKSLFWIFPPLILIFKQPDLGSTLTLIAIWVGMLIGAKISVKKVLILLMVGLLIIPFVWFSLQDYQKERLFGFLTPGSDPLGRGYNLIQSTIAVGSGELMGRGIGRGTQSRLQFLPEFRTDFIFASIAEELGFVGSVLILILYLTLFLYLLLVAHKSFDMFGYLITYGVVSQLTFQTFVNIGMNVGIVPITGITLPLISYGGSSLLSTFISLGLVASVAKVSKFSFHERG